DMTAHRQGGTVSFTTTGPVRHTEGVISSHAYIAEEATENYVVNPFFDPSGTGWARTRCTLNQDTTVTYDGMPTGRMTKDASSETTCYIYYSSAAATPATEGDVFTFTVRARTDYAGVQ